MTDSELRPVRFSADVAATAAFFGRLGLQPRISSANGVWAEMRAGRGIVAVHAADPSNVRAEPGQTVLSFECPDADARLLALKSAGLESAVIIDESYGRVLSVLDPDGAHIAADERMTDTYGYVDRSADPGLDPRLRLGVVRPSAAPPAMRAFVAACGLSARDVQVTDTGPTDTGPTDTEAPVSPPLLLAPDGTRRPAATVSLRLETAEDLAALTERLERAGHRVDPTPTGAGLRVIDPDGQAIVITSVP